MTDHFDSSTVRVGNIGGLISVCESLGIDVEAALRKVGLTRALFDDPDSVIPYRLVGELYEHAIQRSGCDHFGLLVGMASGDLGLPGFIMVEAPTVRDGLADFVALARRVDDGGVVTLNQVGDSAVLSYAIVTDGMRSVPHICDTAAAVGYRLLARLIGPAFAPTEIRLPRRPPADPAPFRGCFPRGRLTFNAADAAIEFPAHHLGQPIPDADPKLYRFLKGLVGRAGGIERTWSERVRRILPGMVGREEINAAAVARLFDLHPRTLARRLAGENASLRELVEDARLQAARHLLSDTDLKLTEIATTLYYADASAFSRAFRRKFDSAPGAWRRSTRRGAAIVSDPFSASAR